VVGIGSPDHFRMSMFAKPSLTEPSRAWMSIWTASTVRPAFTSMISVQTRSAVEALRVP
jgi:hypothetical protein